MFITEQVWLCDKRECTVVFRLDAADVVIPVNHDQINVIKFSENLATCTDDAFLVLEDNLVTDSSAAQNEYLRIGIIYSNINMTYQTLAFSETVAEA